jgi:DNA polymerase III alpha subunit
MKANYPVEFLAASMTLDMGNTDKLAEFRAEAERLAITVEPPSINRSGVVFDVAGNTIHYALAALRGVGPQAIESILAARGERPFADLADFARRTNPRAINKRVLESLAAAGAFDAIEANRARAFAAVDAILATAHARTRMPPSANRSCSAARRRPSRWRCRRSSRGCRRNVCGANTRRSASSSAVIRSTTMPSRSSGCACSRGPNSPAR